ncbi:hypothetical protein PUNSTDRAFT_67744, partial [Punctularia strigosozonata HHB-11173 SS5]|uniref:uncharacterized protein n=1 Tax=Punctularia strigosozonata (strain HHB-11173) TaxID=741275 RepID=UPI00044167CB
TSSGKTTLCDTLADCVGLRAPSHIEEVARTVMKNTSFSRTDIHKLEMQLAIMEEQTRAETRGKETVARGEAQFLLSDRCVIDALVYTILAATSEEEASRRWEIVVSSAMFPHALASYQDAVVILCAHLTLCEL